MTARCRRRGRAVGALLMTLALVAGCTGDDDEGAPATTAGPTTPTTAPDAPDAPHDTDDAGPTPLSVAGIALAEGQAASTAAPAAAIVAGAPLDDAAVAAVLDRLEPLTADEAEAAPFDWPTETITRPHGEQTDVPFPAAEQVDAPAADPDTLEVLRVQPRARSGWRRSSPSRSTSRWSPSARSPNSPRPTSRRRSRRPSRVAGSGSARRRCASTPPTGTACRWRPTTRVTVPAGTRSASGAELAAAVELSFSTPPADVAASRPTATPGPAAAAGVRGHVRPGRRRRGRAGHVTVTADGEQRAVRLATADEVAADEPAQAAVAGAVAGRARGLHPGRAVRPRPGDRGDVRRRHPVGRGAGRVAEAHRFSMRTYAPLRRHRRAVLAVAVPAGRRRRDHVQQRARRRRLRPGTSTVEPAVTGRTVGAVRQRHHRPGRVAAEQHVPADGPGGHHRRVRPVARRTRHPRGRDRPGAADDPAVRRPLVTVDPSADPAVPVVTVGHEQLHVTVWAADPAQWTDTVSTLYAHESAARTSASRPWPVLRDETIDVGGDPDAPVETSIDLADLMPDGHGQVIVRVAPVREFDAERRGLLEQPSGRRLGAGHRSRGRRRRRRDEPARVGHRSATGTPIEGVTVGDTTGDQTVTTDADGLAVLALPGAAARRLGALTATRDGDVAVLPGVPHRDPGPDAALWHVVDDRGTYRPGETVPRQGLGPALSADRQLQAWDGDDVGYVAYDGTGVEIARGRPHRRRPAASTSRWTSRPAPAPAPAWIAPRRGQPGRVAASPADRRVPPPGLRGRPRPPAPGRTGGPTRSP